MKNFQIIISRFLLILACSTVAATAVAQDHAQKADVVRTDAREKAAVKKVLFIGDSMTGWLSERLNAYGSSNGFEVATVVWDGSTIRKWAETPRLKQIVDQQNPYAVFVSLGMNELFEKNPDTRLKSSVDKIKKAIGDRKLVWVGPRHGPDIRTARPSTTGSPVRSAKAPISAVSVSTFHVRAPRTRIPRSRASSNGLTRSWTGCRSRTST